MNDLYSKKFISFLESKDLNRIKTIPKSDLHNHFVLGGNRKYIKQATGIDIPSLDGGNIFNARYALLE